MRDSLPPKVHKYESGIINMDSSKGPGTHWTAFTKKNKNVVYFDSYGNLQPPLELIKYLNSSGGVNITYNYDRFQNNSYKCGHYCLKFLYNQYNLKKFSF